MSPATSLRRRGAPRELSSSTRTACPLCTSALTRAEPMKPLPPVTRIRLTMTFSEQLFRGGRLDFEPAAEIIGTPGGIEQGLNAQALGEADRRRLSERDAVEKCRRHPRYRRDAAVG